MKLIKPLVDIPKLVRTLWCILWLVLIMFLIAKYCFNIWYPIVIESKIFIKFCDFVDGIPILSTIIMALFYFLNENIQFLTCTKRVMYQNIKEALMLNLFFIVAFVIKYFNNTIGSIIEIINIILLPVFYNLKSKTFNKKILNIFFPIIIYAIVFLFQCNIFLIRGIQDILSEVHFSIALCLQLDYYIFLILTMIGVKYYMGLWGTGWLWSKKVTQYKSLKEQELKKSNPDIKYLKHLEDKISFYENKLNPVNNETNNF